MVNEKQAPAITEISRLNISMAEIKKDISYITSDMAEIKKNVKDLGDGFVKNADFQQYKDFAKAEAARKVDRESFDIYIKLFWVIVTASMGALVNSIFGILKLHI